MTRRSHVAPEQRIVRGSDERIASGREGGHEADIEEGNGLPGLGQPYGKHV
jgi:hypothetical protein